MKDDLKDLFRERFQGHEAPVDPATWQVIEARLIAGGPATDEVNNLFRKRFEQHEVHVDPAVWQGISSQLGHAGAGLLGGFGWAAAGVAGLVVAGGLYFALGTPKEEAVATQGSTQSASIQASTSLKNESEPLAQVAEATISEKRPAEARPHISHSAAPAAIHVDEPTSVPVNTTPTENVATAGQSATEPSTHGTQVVNGIIADMTEQARQEAQSRQAHATDTGNPVSENGPGTEPVATTPEEAPKDPASELFMPTTFTPNGDGINDEYRVVPNVPYNIMHLRVFSLKTNQQVFSTNASEAWTGANCEDGWYMVAVEVMTQDGRVLSEGKVVWLNRQGMN